MTFGYMNIEIKVWVGKELTWAEEDVLHDALRDFFDKHDIRVVRINTPKMDERYVE